ncbi:MAG: Endoribonuclease YbeY [Eubacteriales bacterium SKADARSKE-1]|nr:Endoribonuclease YbeY [Eubacteriales bacterium SKADARSKE-1]
MEKIKVIINDNQKDIKIPTGLRMIVRRACTAVLRSEHFKGSVKIGVTFVNNDEIKELNKKYRKKDMPTDVLSFQTMEKGKYPIEPDTGVQLIGDVVISIEKACEQAKKYGHTLQQEVSFLTTHSVLHLLGYEHENVGVDRIKMREKEEVIMRELGYFGASGYDMYEGN